MTSRCGTRISKSSLATILMRPTDLNSGGTYDRVIRHGFAVTDEMELRSLAKSNLGEAVFRLGVDDPVVQTCDAVAALVRPRQARSPVSGCVRTGLPKQCNARTQSATGRIRTDLGCHLELNFAIVQKATFVEKRQVDRIGQSNIVNSGQGLWRCLESAVNL